MQHISIDPAAASESLARFTVNRAEFARAVDYMARHIVERRATIPILANVLIEAIPGSIRIMATDLDIQGELSLAADVELPGRFTVAAHTLADTLKKCAGFSVCARQIDGRLQLANGQSAFNCPTLPADDFRVIARPSGGKAFTLPAEWARDMASVSPAICKDDSRYYLQGVAMQERAGRAYMVAIDGGNMAVIDRPAPDGMAGMEDAIVSRRTVAAMLAWVKASKATGPLSVDMGASRFVAELPGGLVLTSKLIDGTFPDWARQFWRNEGEPVQAEPVARPVADARANGAVIAKLERAIGAPLSGEWHGNCMLLTCPERPEFVALSMAMRETRETPETPAVETPANPYSAPDGQAADLFGVTPATSHRYGEGYNARYTSTGIAPGARTASRDEWEAYARDYAKRCGLESEFLPVSGYGAGAPCYVASFGGTLTDGRFETIETVDWETLTTSSERVWISPEYVEGSFSLMLPGWHNRKAQVTASIDGGDLVAIPADDKKGIGPALTRLMGPDVKVSRAERASLKAKAATPSAAQELEAEAPAPVPMESPPENLPVQAQQCAQGTDTPPQPQIASSEPEIGQDGAEIVAASVDLAFSAWLTAQFGPWIIAGRQSDKMTQAGKHCITPRQYAKLKAQWERGEREPLPPAPPSVEKAGDDLAAMVAALTARIEALESAAREPVEQVARDAQKPDLVKPKRTPAQVRLLMRYLAMRKERAAMRKSSADDAKLINQIMISEDRIYAREQAQIAKRRRTVIKARATQRAWWRECDLVERLTAAKRETVRDLCDMKERATKAETALIDAHTQAEILGKSLREASERALKAETALAAIQARADGWPPAVHPASVVVNIQRAA